jgi:hypothetical protein
MIQAFNAWLEDFQWYTQIHQHIHPRAAFTDRKLITWLETQWAALKMVEPNIPSFEEGNTLIWTDWLKIVALIIIRYTSTPECNRILSAMSMARDGVGCPKIHAQPRVGEKVKVKFIIKALEK